jgi:glycosyltransferase involved in cell wall biosynthesis
MKTIIVLPAYNAAGTLIITVENIPQGISDELILVDDASKDNTVQIAKELGLTVFVHSKRKGYGANQKTCYRKALEHGADIVVMLHPDYQYDPKVIPHLIKPISEGRADAVFGSRMMKGDATEGGMPCWKYIANILLTKLENAILKTNLSEFHSGFRAYSGRLLQTVNFTHNSNNFVFDTEIISQILIHKFKIEEIPIKTRYFEGASTIKFFPCVLYGLGILLVLLKYVLHTKSLIKFKQFE